MPTEIIQSMNLPLCQECGGRCCLGSPGLWVDPERFMSIFFSGERPTLEQVRERLPALGLVLWEKSGVPIPAPESLTIGCAFHGVLGCDFSIKKRPCQCLALIPVPETLEQPQGCLCRLPEVFNREVAMLSWQNYWRTVAFT